MAIRKSSSSGIPFGNNAGRPVNPNSGQPYFNGETARLELFTASNSWENIVQEVPGVSSISGNYSETNNSGVITIYGTNFVAGATAYAIGSNAVQVAATSTTFNSLVQVTATFTGLSSAYEPYDIKVTNPSNLFGLLPDALYVNNTPSWQTAAGSLGTFQTGDSISLTVSATDPDSTVTYSLAAGSSLPSGLTLNSTTGVISGIHVVNTSTNYTFTINASDGVNPVIPRTFSILIQTPVISGGTVTSDSTYYYRAFTSSENLIVSNGTINADILMVGGGGAGGPGYGDQDTGKGGGGAGGILYKAGHTLSPNTYSITVGNGGAGRTRGNNTTPPPANVGQPTIAFGVQANGGGGGGGSDDHAGTGPSQGGSGGGAGARNTTGSFLTGASSNQASYSGWTSYGNSGANAQNGNFGGGGGGGAGGAGLAASGGANDSTGGNGGPGVNFSTIFGTSFGAAGWFGGGGGGGSYARDSVKPQSLGGQGGGGNGVSAREHSQGGQWLDVGINGVANTGGGGGGSSEDAGLRENAGSQSGSGGSGIVILRYTKASVGG